MKRKLLSLVLLLGLLLGCETPRPEITSPVFRHEITFSSRIYRELYNKTAYIRVTLTTGAVIEGSAVVIAEKSFLTAAHMVPEDTAFIDVFLPNSQTFIGRVDVADYFCDLAVISVNEIIEIPPIKISEVPSAVGSEVVICGSSYGVSFTNTISTGMITGQCREWYVYPGIMFYQTDALIVGGNSGGPWTNSKGELIAITSWGSGPSGNIGFGVPERYIREMMSGRSSIK